MGFLRLHRQLSCDSVVGVIQRGEDGADPRQENDISKTVSSYPNYKLDSLMRVHDYTHGVPYDFTPWGPYDYTVS